MIHTKLFKNVFPAAAMAKNGQKRTYNEDKVVLYSDPGFNKKQKYTHAK